MDETVNVLNKLEDETLQQISINQTGIHQSNGQQQSQNQQALINQPQVIYQQGNNNGGLHIEIPANIKSLSFNNTSGNSFNGQIPQFGKNLILKDMYFYTKWNLVLYI